MVCKFRKSADLERVLILNTAITSGWTAPKRFIASVVGAAGGFLVGIIVTFLQAYLPPDLRGFRDAFAFAIVILVLLLRPAGLIQAKNVIERV